jgi:hypothetical protein
VSSQSAIKGGNGLEDVAAPRVVGWHFNIERLEERCVSSFENLTTFVPTFCTSGLLFRTGSVKQHRERHTEAARNSCQRFVPRIFLDTSLEL